MEGMGWEDEYHFVPAAGEFRHQVRGREKRANRKLARVRARVEDAIAVIKICRITKDVFRNLPEGSSDLAMSTATGLHNFRRASRRSRHKSTDAYFG